MYFQCRVKPKPSSIQQAQLMGSQRGLVGPLLEEEQPHRVLAIDMHVMRNAAGLLARTLDVLDAGAKHVVEGIFARQNTAGNHNHADAPARARRPRTTALTSKARDDC